MASTSTNKQPMLIDRVLHVVVDLAGATVNPGAGIEVGGTNTAAPLIDSTSGDGAIIEDVYLISRGTSAYDVNLYISTARDYLRPNETYYVGTIKSATTAKDVTRWDEMPYCLVPTPHVGSDSRNRAFYLPKGYALWAARDADTPVTDGPLIGVQGGWY